MSAITIESNGIKIPVDAIEGEGLMVLTLAAHAHLIARTEIVKNYSTETWQRLLEVVRVTQPTTPPPAYHLYSPRKAHLLQELREQGYPVSGGEDYFAKQADTVPSLEQVRDELSVFKGSLSDEVIAEREER